MSSIGLPIAPIHRRVTVLAMWVIAVCMIILRYFLGRFRLYVIQVIAVVSWCWSDTGFGYLYFCRLLGLTSGFVGIITKERSQCVKTQWQDQGQAERVVDELRTGQRRGPLRDLLAQS